MTLIVGINFTTSGAEFYDAGSSRGLETIVYASPDNYNEECVIPKPFPGTTYSKNSFKDMQKLCSIDFYDFSGDKAICPKIMSTSPALEIHKFTSAEANSRKDYEEQHCAKTRHRPGKKIAKFKQSITCSYVQSPLAYPQVAEVLGGILHVPETVIRTMDINEHSSYVKKAQATVDKIYSSERTIHKAWHQNWRAAHANPRDPAPRSVKGPNLFTDDLAGVYGVLMENPRGEDKYSEVNRRQSYSTRYTDFKRNLPYVNIANSRPLVEFVSQDFVDSAQVIQQMKDVSDLVVMDTLLNQQDRVGNIHYRNYAHFLVNGKLTTKKIKLDSSGKIEAKSQVAIDKHNPTEVVVVKEMILKDNDCGVAKANLARTNDWLDGIAHIKPQTYYRLLWLNQAVQREEIRDYFMKELLFDQRDWDGRSMSFKKNVEFAANLLLEKCRSGRLMLDLDSEAHINGKNPKDFRDKCELPEGFTI